MRWGRRGSEGRVGPPTGSFPVCRGSMVTPIREGSLHTLSPPPEPITDSSTLETGDICIASMIKYQFNRQGHQSCLFSCSNFDVLQNAEIQRVYMYEIYLLHFPTSFSGTRLAKLKVISLVNIKDCKFASTNIYAGFSHTE